MKQTNFMEKLELNKYEIELKKETKKPTEGV